MEEFEKWEHGDCYSRECSATDCGEVACTDCEDLRRDGWRAALEWVKTLPSSGTYKFEEPMCFINKELEGSE